MRLAARLNGGCFGSELVHELLRIGRVATPLTEGRSRDGSACRRDVDRHRATTQAGEPLGNDRRAREEVGDDASPRHDRVEHAQDGVEGPLLVAEVLDWAMNVGGLNRGQLVEREPPTQRNVQEAYALVGGVHRSQHVQVRRNRDLAIGQLSEPERHASLVGLDVGDELAEYARHICSVDLVDYEEDLR
jgi:hypothetical protein